MLCNATGVIGHLSFALHMSAVSVSWLHAQRKKSRGRAPFSVVPTGAENDLSAIVRSALKNVHFFLLGADVNLTELNHCEAMKLLPPLQKLYFFAPLFTFISPSEMGSAGVEHR